MAITKYYDRNGNPIAPPDKAAAPGAPPVPAGPPVAVGQVQGDTPHLVETRGVAAQPVFVEPPWQSLRPVVAGMRASDDQADGVLGRYEFTVQRAVRFDGMAIFGATEKTWLRNLLSGHRSMLLGPGPVPAHLWAHPMTWQEFVQAAPADLLLNSKFWGLPTFDGDEEGTRLVQGQHASKVSDVLREGAQVHMSFPTIPIGATVMVAIEGPFDAVALWGVELD